MKKFKDMSAKKNLAKRTWQTAWLIPALLPFAQAAESSDALEQAQVAEKQKNYSEALEHYRTAFQDASSHEQAALGTARVFVSMGKREEAQQVLDRSLAESPFSVSARLARAEFFRQGGDLKAAEADLSILERFKPDSLEVKEQRAYIAIERKNYDRGVTFLGAVLKKNPENDLARLRRAQAYVQWGKLEQATPDFVQLSERLPDNAQVQVTLGEHYVRLKQYKQAETAYQFAMTLEARSAPLHEKIGDLRAKQERFDDAIASYQTAVQTDPRLVSAGGKLAELYMQKGKTDEAEKEWTRQHQMAPGFMPASQGLVAVWNSTGKHGMAGSFLKNHVSKFPEQHWAKVELAKLMVKVDDFDGAERLISKLPQEYRTTQVDVGLVSSYIEKNKGNIQTAIAVLEKLDDNVPGDARVQYNLGLLYEELGDLPNAREWFGTIKKNSPLYGRAQIASALILEKAGQIQGAIEALKAVTAPEYREEIALKVSTLEGALRQPASVAPTVAPVKGNE